MNQSRSANGAWDLCIISTPRPPPQVNDVSTVIPRNSVIEANQSGLIAEPLVDITPQVGGGTAREAQQHNRQEARGHGRSRPGGEAPLYTATVGASFLRRASCTEVSLSAWSTAVRGSQGCPPVLAPT